MYLPHGEGDKVVEICVEVLDLGTHKGNDVFRARVIPCNPGCVLDGQQPGYLCRTHIFEGGINLIPKLNNICVGFIGHTLHRLHRAVPQLRKTREKRVIQLALVLCPDHHQRSPQDATGHRACAINQQERTCHHIGV